MTATMEFWLYLPQMRMSMDEMATRARAAEAAGFGGVAGMDHLAPPLAESQPMYEAMITNAWLAAQTSDLKVGSLVLCDSFRHPVVLAREAVTLDHASGGRFELGIGWGSVTAEFAMFGIGAADGPARVGRLKESLDILNALWRGEAFDYEGEHFSLRGAQQQPTPLGRIPIVVGGAGRKTMELVATYADWWNVHIAILDRYDEMRPLAGRARCSLQAQVAFVREGEEREEVEATARRRFGERIVAGTAAELIDYFGALAERDVERVYVWLTDFAQPGSVTEFGETVIAALQR
jgi:alkanesulfonate monooxygenase SsuD/methylene tetrahydromethanopterin reductase-like flavin-dependent oxidoreductase (luciferase family)